MYFFQLNSVTLTTNIVTFDLGQKSSFYPQIRHATFIENDCAAFYQTPVIRTPAIFN